MKNLVVPFLAFALFATSCSKDEAVATPPSAPTATIITSADASKNFPASGTISRSTFPAGSVPLMVEGPNMIFSYGNITVTAASTTNGANVANTSFPTATSTLNYNTTFFGSTSNTAAVDYLLANGTNLLLLGTQFGVTNISFPGVGSISFPLQSVVLSTPQKLAEFPMKYNDTSTQNLTSTVNFFVTSPALPAPNVPARYIDTETITNVNVAWGSLRIPGYAAPMQTLVQKVTERNVRNYFLMGAGGAFGPMPAQLLQAVQLTDGAVTTTVYYRYWVAGKGFVMVSNDLGGGVIFNGL